MEYETPALNTKYGVCTINISMDGKIIKADRGFTEMTGYGEEDIKNNLSYRTIIAQGERRGLFERMKNDTIKNGMSCMEHFIRCKNGAVVTASCFARSLGGGYVDVMLTKNIGHITDNSGSGYDALTGFYKLDAALAEINRILSSSREELHSILLFKLKNVRTLEEAYGKAFVGTVVENMAIYIYNQYRAKGRKVVMSRVRYDTFLVLHCADEPEEVEGVALWSCSEMCKNYFGRYENIDGRIILGMYHMNEGETFAESLMHAEEALAYADESGARYEIYNKSVDYPKVTPVYDDESDNSDGDRIFTYDSRFLSFAVAMLANAKDINSSLDVLIQRIGWQFALNRVMVSVFEKSHYARVTNMYVKGEGVITENLPVNNLRDWDNFFKVFDSNGCMKIKDIENSKLSDRDKEYYRSHKIRSVVNYLLYDNEQLIGYVAFGAERPIDKWSTTNINTLVQLSKIIAIFASKRRSNEENEQRYAELSIDPLTGLYIYPAFITAAKKALYSYNPNKAYACIYVDIDNFSYINENFGYEAGNKILKNLAYKMQMVRAEGGLCCHIHADRFLCFSIRNSREEIENVVRRVNREIHESCREIYLMGNIRVVSGIYYIENPQCNIVSAIDRAIQAWKNVKNDKYITYGVYTDEIAKRRQHRLDIIGSVHNAIKDGYIEAFMQPKFSMKTMKVIGAEALARWRNEDGSYKYPDQFIPLLEEVGYIVDVDFCIYEQVMKAMSRWKADGKELIPISVNFSRRHINYDNFAERIRRLTKQYDIDTKYIEIEMTESVFSKKPEKMMRFMNELRKEGYKIDIDDFGTGYSSLNMLLDVPVDIVKIDKSFIDDYESDIKQKYINQIGGLIKTAQKDIIFEGVETTDQMRFLTNCGYENAQGYIFSKPIPLKDFEKKYIYSDNIGKVD